MTELANALLVIVAALGAISLLLVVVVRLERWIERPPRETLRGAPRAGGPRHRRPRSARRWGRRQR
jgi:hypothetical protein